MGSFLNKNDDKNKKKKKNEQIGKWKKERKKEQERILKIKAFEKILLCQDSSFADNKTGIRCRCSDYILVDVTQSPSRWTTGTAVHSSAINLSPNEGSQFT